MGKPQKLVQKEWRERHKEALREKERVRSIKKRENMSDEQKERAKIKTRQRMKAHRERKRKLVEVEEMPPYRTAGSEMKAIQR